MRLRPGMTVREPSRKVGQIPRQGKVLAVKGSTVEVLWSDGHRSSLSGGFLLPVHRGDT